MSHTDSKSGSTFDRVVIDGESFVVKYLDRRDDWTMRSSGQVEYAPTIRVNGRYEVLSCRLSEEAAKLNDREMLEELIRSAANQAIERVRQQVAEETSKMASGLGLPPGMSLPGAE